MREIPQINISESKVYSIEIVFQNQIVVSVEDLLLTALVSNKIGIFVQGGLNVQGNLQISSILFNSR